MLDGLSSAIGSLAEEWSIAMTDEMSSQVRRYVELLLVWNRSVNLTGAGSFEDIVGEHLPDSFALAQLILPGSDVVDIGSGGGLPGIPFAIIRPDCEMTLVEPRAKRVAFLNTARREVGCKSVTVVRGRVEDLASSVFRVATSRATFAPREWLELSQRIVVPGGRCVVFAASATGGNVGSASIVEELVYRTRRGAPRWIGVYCFT